jgi:hypothetical protein
MIGEGLIVNEDRKRKLRDRPIEHVSRASQRRSMGFDEQPVVEVKNRRS